MINPDKSWVSTANDDDQAWLNFLREICGGSLSHLLWTNFLLLKRPSHQAIASGKSAVFESADELNNVWAKTETFLHFCKHSEH